ncbi:MAG: TIGR02281 family clan AA aspartic protease [Gammaproteobacteria bacterium]|nr:TIGR02281 family clan AA aspartic protease [Gammaproteobacteria bacterium]
MVYVAWILLVILLTLLFSKLLDHQNNPNQNPEGRLSAEGLPEVLLKRNRMGHYVASGRINGISVTFLLDTGATDVALSEKLAMRLLLDKGVAVTSRTANGTVISWRTRLNEVALGDIRLYDVRATVLPSMLDDEVLLGMSFLKRLEMVQRGDQLVLRQY